MHILSKFHLGHEGNVNGFTKINAFECGSGFSLSLICFEVKKTKTCGQKFILMAFTLGWPDVPCYMGLKTMVLSVSNVHMVSLLMP